MDKVYIAHRLKKYLFLVSIIFLFLTISHTFYSYVSHDAKKTAIKGGTFSEAIIGEVPSLNPLKNNSEQNQYVNSILYRSLLKYDITEKKIVSDLAKCDISDLLEVKCFLTDTPKWSNGETITYDDIESTFKTLKENNLDQNLHNLLKSTTIVKNDTSIVFKNAKKDIDFLKIFFQPVVSKKILSLISKKELEGNFSLQSGLFSGLYIVSNITKDEISGSTTITLSKNLEYTDNPVYIDTILFKVFPTINDFIKNKGTINVFNDKNNIISGTLPRLQEYKYTLPKYTSLFLNTKKIQDNDFRGFLLNQVDRSKIISTLGETKFKEVINPFMSDTQMNVKESKFSLENYLKKKSFFTKAELITLTKEQLKNVSTIPLEKIATPLISNEVKLQNISAEATIQKEKTVNNNSGEINPKSKTIISPNWVDKYNFIKQSDILLTGKVEAGVSAIYINDYKLRNFSPGNNTFYYRISQERGTIKTGENTYNIYFEKSGKKVLADTINFYLNRDANALKQFQDTFLASLNKKTEEQTNTNSSNEDLQNGTLKNSENIAASENDENELKQLQKKLTMLEELSPDYYYNNKGEKFSLELYVLSDKKDSEITAATIQESLKLKGIHVNIRQISFPDLSNLLEKGQKNYDMILARIHLSYFDFNIYSYFHTNEIKNKFNFSNFRMLDLDIPLEELKTTIHPSEKIKKNQEKILSLINTHNLIKTIYTPVHTNLVDKSIKSYNLEKNIPENSYRFLPFKKSYIQEESVMSIEDKNLKGYLQFIFGTLLEK